MNNIDNILSQIISFNTVSSLSNLPMIDWLESFLNEHGGKTQRLYSNDRKKANLLARFGPQEAGGIIISAHTDVVPTTQQKWESDPFKLTIKDDLLHGRGCCDMKGPIACALSALQDTIAATAKFNDSLKAPIYFSLSYDEEVGCQGVQDLTEHFASKEPPIDCCVVIEPTNLVPLEAHKGIYVLHSTIRGVPAHSSQTHKGVSAVMVAGELLHWINEKAKQLSAQPCKENYHPPHTTIHSGLIKGGTAFNIMAEYADFFWDLRYINQSEAKEILAHFEQFCSQLLQEFVGFDVDIHTETDSCVRNYQIDAFAKQFLQKHTDIQFDPEYAHVSYVTEAGLFQQKKIPTVVCGPGDPLQAHQPNEHICRKQLELGTDFLQSLYRAMIR